VVDWDERKSLPKSTQNRVTQKFYLNQKKNIWHKKKHNPLFKKYCLFSFSLKSFATPFPALFQLGINVAHNVRGHYGKIRLIMPVGITGKSGPEH